MAQIIHTYYEEIWPIAARILNKFERSWKMKNWEVRVLTLDNAIEHPFYDEFMHMVSTYPTINDRRYELCCYRRWLAFAMADSTVGEIITADYDILNLGLDESQFQFESNVAYFYAGLNCFNREVFKKFIHYMYSWLPDGREHVSDMYLLQDFIYQSHKVIQLDHSLVSDYPETGKPLLHFRGSGQKQLFIDYPLQ